MGKKFDPVQKNYATSNTNIKVKHTLFELRVYVRITVNTH